MSMLFSPLIFSFFVFLTTANIQVGSETPDVGETFGRIITQTGMRLQETAPRRPLKLKSMNDALEDLALAMRLMASRASSGDIRKNLAEVRNHYPESGFAWLLEGVWLNAHGDTLGACEAWEQFLLRSRTYTELDKAFIGWDDFHKLRRIVYELLLTRGVSFEGREKEIQVRVPFAQLAGYLRNPGAEDRWMSILFLSVLVGGFFFFAGLFLTGYPLSLVFLQPLKMLYGVFWFAYAVWVIDLALGLPLGWTRFKMIPLILGAGMMAALFQTVSGLRNRRVVLEDGCRRCPGCKGIVTRLHLECPECRKPLP